MCSTRDCLLLFQLYLFVTRTKQVVMNPSCQCCCRVSVHFTVAEQRWTRTLSRHQRDEVTWFAAAWRRRSESDTCQHPVNTQHSILITHAIASLVSLYTLGILCRFKACLFVNHALWTTVPVTVYLFTYSSRQCEVWMYITILCSYLGF